MNITDEQHNAVYHNGNILVVACPGSGKTRAIIARLLRSVDEILDTPRKVACITYTNTAVHEIENRIRIYGGAEYYQDCDVSTIHSFCQNNILRHFYWELDKFKDGVTVLPSDSEEYHAVVDEIGDRYNLSFFERQQFESINRRPNGDPITSLPHEAVYEFWGYLEANGYVDFCNLIYFSYRLLRDNRYIVRGLTARYAHILVDEFQDTSALQVQILSLIANEGLTTFFLVGDPEQSIYRFAGAERELMFTYAHKIKAKVFQLSGNFRSSKPVINRAENLITRNPSMFSVGESAKFMEEPFHKRVENYSNGITDFFLPALNDLDIPLGDAAILAPTWFQLHPLGRFLRNYGVPVVGPGARPYKKSKYVFVGLAEHACAYADDPKSISIYHFERELFNFIQNVTGEANFGVFDFNGRRVALRLLKEAQYLQKQYMGAVDWLNSAAKSFSEILNEEGFLPNDSLSILSESVSDIVQDMESRNDVDVPNMTTSDLGMFANPLNSIKLLTMHGAKGREFGGVAIIGLHEGLVPYHNYYNPLTQEGLEESRRLMYVSITRARRLLVLFTEQGDDREESRFLAEMEFRPSIFL